MGLMQTTGRRGAVAVDRKGADRAIDPRYMQGWRPFGSGHILLKF